MEHQGINTLIYTDNEQYLFVDVNAKDDNVSGELFARYQMALLEWEAVQDELAEIYKAQ
jgi:hypothetical protein